MKGKHRIIVSAANSIIPACRSIISRQNRQHHFFCLPRGRWHGFAVPVGVNDSLFNIHHSLKANAGERCSSPTIVNQISIFVSAKMEFHIAVFSTENLPSSSEAGKPTKYRNLPPTSQTLPLVTAVFFTTKPPSLTNGFIKSFGRQNVKHPESHFGFAGASLLLPYVRRFSLLGHLFSLLKREKGEPKAIAQ